MTTARSPIPGSAALHRRHILQALLGASGAFAAPQLFAQGRSQTVPGRLVVVFLRGAYDGLSALVPYADKNYYALRPNIAIAAPDGSDQTTLALDSQFGLHPALATLMPLWKEGVLSALPCAGSPDPTRSHFDAQHQWEIGIPGKSSNAPGWLNTLANLSGGASQRATITQTGTPELKAPSDDASAGQSTNAIGAHALGVGEANPQILSGSAPVQLVPRGDAATKPGALGDERTRAAVLSLYAGTDELSRVFRAGADSRMQTAQTLSDDMAATQKMNGMNTMEAVMLAANNGAGPARGLALDAQHLGVLMRKDHQLRLGFLSAGGWDTHAGQGAVTGTLANNLGALATALVQLRRDFSQTNDVVVVVSEFGRTSAENGTRGTDHGHGNTLWLMGNRVQGGRWHGQWNGLAAADLHEGRDLPVHNDFRAVLAQVLNATQGLKPKQLDALFPGFTWDTSLNGLMRV